MTDTSHYTGMHKERFDAEGHGKGKEGRVDEVKITGYVGNYKGEGTYDKKHWMNFLNWTLSVLLYSR